MCWAKVAWVTEVKEQILVPRRDAFSFWVRVANGSKARIRQVQQVTKCSVWIGENCAVHTARPFVVEMVVRLQFENNNCEAGPSGGAAARR